MALWVGCATTSTTAGDLDLAETPEGNIQRGDDALKSKSYQEAERYYEYVKGKYPFLEAAKVAELRIADTSFEREQFTESRDQYLNFVKLHPTHPRVDYAAYRAALTHYKDIPSEFFLLPPAEEKDQVEVKGALKSMNDFIRSYPQSTHVSDAQKVVDDCKRRLVAHEWYVARFYAKREMWGAVAARLEGLITDYAGAPLQAEVAQMVEDVYVHLQTPQKAKDTLKRLVERFPGSPAAAAAQKLLGS